MEYVNFDDMTPAELNAWYEVEVGYRPQDDDPDMTDDDLREMCRDFERATNVKIIVPEHTEIDW